jgi:DNA-binding CsgD family transcriptional regulator
MFAHLTTVPELANAGLDHERLDGSGYPSATGGNLPPAARLVAAADVFHALLERRPHREPLSPDAAEPLPLKEAQKGRLDADASRAVLKAAGRRVARRVCAFPAGLTEREVEVLRLVAIGLINREMADRLGISAATVDHHIRHIYDKIGVSTRAAATVFAMQNALIDPTVSTDA